MTPPKAQAVLQPANLAGVRVLLAEDGPENQMLLGAFLARSGAAVTFVANGRLAVEAARSASFDVLLMDMDMPEMDGYEATSLLRRDGYSRPIIALTAHAAAGDRDLCVRAGCDDFLSKPTTRSALLHCVARWVHGAHVFPSAGEHEIHRRAGARPDSGIEWRDGCSRGPCEPSLRDGA
jgi:CheY-like chemotaxis protein